MQHLRLSTSIIAGSLLFSSLTFAGGPDQKEKIMPFTGFSMMAGPTAVRATPGTILFQTRNNDASGTFAEAANIATNQYWSTGARIGLEYGVAITQHVYIGVNANFITGENWTQALHPTFDFTDRTLATTTGPYSMRWKYDLQYYVNTLIKFGFIFDDSFLLYAEGGAGAANIFTQDITDFNNGIAVNGASWASGWSAGAGIEWQFCDKFSLGAEYLYSGFQRRYIDTQVFSDQFNITTPRGWVSAAMTMQTVNAYLRYFFNS